MVVTLCMEREGLVRMTHAGKMVPDLTYSAVEIQRPRGFFHASAVRYATDPYLY